MNIYSFLLHIHSGLRWIAILILIMSIANAIHKLSKKSRSNTKDCIFNRLALIMMHLQLVFGLVLYFISPKVIFEFSSMQDKILRFFLVEHISLMVIAIILVTIGYIRADRAVTEIKRYKNIIIYYSIVLLIILAAIPWPFRELGGGWF
jgi:hypothetical protein